jgi:hypothetical protein
MIEVPVGGGRRRLQSYRAGVRRRSIQPVDDIAGALDL